MFGKRKSVHKSEAFQHVEKMVHNYGLAPQVYFDSVSKEKVTIEPGESKKVTFLIQKSKNWHEDYHPI